MTVSRFIHGAIAKVDAYDRKLLHSLSTDGRATAANLGRQLRLSREVVSYRLRKLEQSGVIQSYTVVPRFKKIGVRLYRVALLLDEKQRALHESLVNHMTHHSHTHSVIRLNDTWDICWTFICSSIDEFDTIIREVNTKFSNAIIDFEKYAIITTYASNMMPAVQRPHVSQQLTRNVTLDAVDKKLLQVLSSRGRDSTYELAPAIGLSNDAVLMRMKKLKANEFIGGYTPVINLAALGYSWYIYVVQLSHLTEADEAKLSEYVATHPHILRATKCFGKWELMLDIVVQNIDEYYKTAKEIKNVFAHIIRRYESWSVYEELHYCAIPSVLTVK
jgi:DNA-binding Lrp family transcriptional regulator